MIELPKPDKRYKPGKIVRDKNGVFRGHPDSVTLKTANMPNELQLNPPLIATPELAKFIEKRL